MNTISRTISSDSCVPKWHLSLTTLRTTDRHYYTITAYISLLKGYHLGTELDQVPENWNEKDERRWSIRMRKWPTYYLSVLSNWCWCIYFKTLYQNQPETQNPKKKPELFKKPETLKHHNIIKIDKNAKSEKKNPNYYNRITRIIWINTKTQIFCWFNLLMLMYF